VALLPDSGSWPPITGLRDLLSLDVSHSVGLLWTSYQPDTDMHVETHQKFITNLSCYVLDRSFLTQLRIAPFNVSEHVDF